MKRNVFSLFCAAAIATQFFTPKAVTAEDNTFDCFTYEIQSDHVKLTSFTIPARRVDYIIIPSVICYLPVTEIADGVFYDLKSFLYVYWPETLTVIPSYTFGGNNSTIAIVLPDTLEKIEDHAFPDGIQDVFYSGSSEEWDQVMIGSGNEGLLNANIHCDRNAVNHPFSFQFGENDWSFTNGDMEKYLMTSSAVQKYLGDCGEWIQRRYTILGQEATKHVYNGICGGMATSSFLSACGILDASEIYPGAKTLHDIPLCDEAMEALFLYWHLGIDVSGAAPRLDSEMMIGVTPDTIFDYLGEKFSPGTATIMLPSYGIHEVLVYGTEFGMWNYNDTTYIARVLVYDNNASGFSEEHCIYVAENGEMYIPHYEKATTISGFNVFPSPDVYVYSIGNRTPYTSTYSLGDPDASGEVNSADASSILVAAAASGLDQATGMNFGQLKSADVDADGEISAVDASLVLCYAAKTGLGKFSGTVTDYLSEQEAIP